MILKGDKFSLFGLSRVPVLGMLILSMSALSHAQAICPDLGCPPFQVDTSNGFRVDSLYKYLNLQPERRMQVELLPRDTGMTWEYQYASYSNNRSVLIKESYVLRFKLLASKDSGNFWVSRWQYGYQGWRRFTIVQPNQIEIPWTTLDTVITKSKDSGLFLEKFLPYRKSGDYMPFTRFSMRPLATDTFAVGSCCNHSIAKGQSQGDLYAISRYENAIYQKDRGLIFFGILFAVPDFWGYTTASLSYYGREPGPVPVNQPYFLTRRDLQKKRREVFGGGLHKPIDVLGRTYRNGFFLRP